ncbi:MAG: S1C family serine protease [Propioniciclava sp.]
MTYPHPAPPPQVPPRNDTAKILTLSILAMAVSLIVTLLSFVGLAAWVLDSTENQPTPALPAAPQPSVEQTTGPVSMTESLQRGVVLITGKTPADGIAGTGMVLTAEGLVVTNYHVVRSTEQLTATIASSGERFNATMVGRDATADVALLQLHGAQGLHPVTIDADPVDLGDVAIAAGNANGQGYVSANRGNVQNLDQSIKVRGPAADDPAETLTGLIETNAAAFPGDSGGPMFDADHEVLGMTTAGSDSDDSTHVYAVPIAQALEVVAKIRAGDESGSVVIGPKAFLGIVVDNGTGGLDVTHVESGTPAWVSGIRQGDRILALDDATVDTRLELSHVLDGLEPGTTTTLRWERDGVVYEEPVTVSASPIN